MEAILEMCRIAGEVRVFPLVDMFDRGRSPHVDAVVGRLRALGCVARIKGVPYEFQRGGNQMLRIVRE